MWENCIVLSDSPIYGFFYFVCELGVNIAKSGLVNSAILGGLEGSI